MTSSFKKANTGDYIITEKTKKGQVDVRNQQKEISRLMKIGKKQKIIQPDSTNVQILDSTLKKAEIEIVKSWKHEMMINRWNKTAKGDYSIRERN